MSKFKPIHPFPARMAPDLALGACSKLVAPSVVLDPMCGSGTTLRAAIDKGHCAIGSDLDPLAVLISSVNATPLDSLLCVEFGNEVVAKAINVPLQVAKLPWIDGDLETQQFITFWFAQKQINALRRLVFVIFSEDRGVLQDFLKVALSRLIFTKEMGASLARDTAHSRPHRVARINDYDVFSQFVKSVEQLAERIPKPYNSTTSASVRLADARNLDYVRSGSVDAVITSPPYLNAIDYMRGSKFSLVWLGYKISDLRHIRGNSIGAEKRPSDGFDGTGLGHIVKGLDFYERLARKERGMFDRYVIDTLHLAREIERVLKPGGAATLVVGNSCLRGEFIKNTDAVILAAQAVGLNYRGSKTRELPLNRRYMPMPADGDASALAKRMRTESTLTFVKS